MRTNLLLIAMAATSLAAQPAEIHVLVSNGFRAVMEEVRPQSERAIGHPLAMEFNSSTALKEKIDGGQAFDVAILTSDVVNDLAKEGKLVSGSTAGVGRGGIGVGVRAGAAKPDIRTAAGLKQTLLKAKSITFAQDGASRVFIYKMFDHFGIADDVKSKLILEQGSTRANAKVADGSAELILTLVSEILPAPGVDLVGPLPTEVQNYISMSAGVNSKAHDADSAKALVKFLASPSIAAALKAKGMEPVH
jgi:molybdate transport system substrate-binding protein